ncbi:MAG: response regulator [Gemmatimonadetes bacterium]|nr:MAG: response regulator [Gemmatimonadota bacterium]
MTASNTDILIVDDQPANLNLLTSILTEQGYTTRLALDGEIALRMARHQPPDIILLDILMPVMDGLMVCQKLKADPALQAIPVIFLSAVADTSKIAKGFACGGVDYITKPFRVGEVLARIETHLKMSRITRDLEAKNRALEQANQHLQELAQQLKQSQHEFEAIFNNAVVGIALSAPDGTFERANPRWLEMLGYDADELNQLTLDMITHEKDRETSSMYIRRVQLGELVQYRFEKRFVRKDGSEFWGDIAVAAITDDAGNLCHLVAALTDITRRKIAEQELKAFNAKLEKKVVERTVELQHALEREKEINDLKSRFITSVSHEFRTPLTIIQTGAEILYRYKESLNPEREAQHLQSILKQVQHMNCLLEDVLNVGQIERDGWAFNPYEIRLKVFLEQFRMEYHAGGDANRIEFHYHGTDSVAIMDEKMVRLILNNLIDNALKYSPPDRPVHVELYHRPEAVTFTVRDHGIGIPADDQKYIFTPFFRAKNVEHIQGTGVGLTIVNHAVHLHQGDIQITSELDQGTTVTVTFPQKSPSRAAEPTTTED